MTNLEPGQSFGHYTIVSQSASDEGGALFRAYDSAAANDVLLRVLAPSLAQAPGFAERFESLGAALRKLSHPNILRVLESGIVDGTPYWSMPIVDAAPLSERIASGQVAPAQADKLVGQIAGALQYAHDNGVVHGALSPAHVLVDGAGNALLTDFGLAALQAGTVAPDPRTDVAALRGVLLSLLTGTSTPPDSAALTAALGQLASTLPADRRDAAAAAYTGVIAKLTTAIPADRFDSARSFLSAWQEVGKSAVGSGAMPAGMGTPSGSTPPPLTRPPVPGASSPPSYMPPPPTPPAVPPRVSPPPVPGLVAPPSPAAINLAQRAKALADQAQLLADQKAKAIADEQAKTLAQEQAARAGVSAAVAHSAAEFAQAQARDAAARGAGAKGSVRDGVRAALEITQRLARGTSDPVRKAALEQIVADIQRIGNQRAGGQLNDETAHAAISDLVKQVRALEAQGAPVSREAITGVAAAALSQAQSVARADVPAVAQVVRQQAAAAARPAANRARPVIFGGVGLIMVVCVGLMIVCAVAVSALPSDTTPTPRARVTESQTRSAPVPTLRAPVVLSTPRAGRSPAAAVPVPTAAPLRTSVVFTDTFAPGNCNLVEGDDSRRTLKCDHNEYVMLVKSSTARWVYYDAPPEYRNTVIDFDARAISSSPAMEYGAIWRVSSDGTNFYGFTLKPSGEMAVFISNNSDFTYFTQGFPLSNFRTGGGVNHITITANGPNLSFALNGEVLPLTLSDPTLTSGTFGFIVDTSAPNAQAAFSNLVVSEIQ